MEHFRNAGYEIAPANPKISWTAISPRRSAASWSPRPIEAWLSGVFDDALHEDACGCLPNQFEGRMSRAQSLLAELQGAPRPGGPMSSQTINSLRASKNRMRVALDKVAASADSFAAEAEAMGDVSGDTFANAGMAMKAIVQEITEVREIFDLDPKANGGPPLNPTVAPGTVSAAPGGSSSVKIDATGDRIKNYPDGGSYKSAS